METIVQASSDLTNPEQAVILENLVVNGIKTLDLNHLGNPLQARAKVGILPPKSEFRLRPLKREIPGMQGFPAETLH